MYSGTFSVGMVQHNLVVKPFFQSFPLLYTGKEG